MYYPRYLVKRTRLVVLFGVMSAMAGFIQDPKLFRFLSTQAQIHQISTGMLGGTLCVVLLVSFGLIWAMLEPRYARRGQAVAASLLFLAIFVAASLAGFAHGALRQPMGGNEMLIAAMALTVSASAMTAIYSALYQRKVDYTKLRAEISSLMTLIDELSETFRLRGYLAESDSTNLRNACRAARDAAAEAVKTEIPAYATYVQRAFTEPLKILAAAADEEIVAESPESFLRACGVLSGRGAPNEDVSSAFRVLANGT